GKRSFLLIVLLFLGCATHRQNIRDYSEKNTLFSNETGYISASTDLWIRAATPLDTSAEHWKVSTAVLDHLLGTLRKRAGHPSRFYRILVIDLPSPNAFAVPDGEIVVTSGLMNMAPSESALAGVLAHEVGHVELNHAGKRLDRSDGNLLSAIFTYKFDQEEELEADRFGVSLAAEAGYGSDGLIEFFEAMRAWIQQTKQPDGGFLSTHPSTLDRIGQLTKLAAESRKSHTEDPLSGNDFVSMRSISYREYRDYAGFMTGDDEPPRLLSGDPQFDKQLLAISERIRGNFDLWKAAVLLSELKPASSRLQAVVENWWARLAIQKRDFEGATGHLIHAAQLSSEFQTTIWLRFMADAMDGKHSGMRQRWLSQTSRSPCIENVDCTFWALQTYRFAGISSYDAGEFAKKAREHLIQIKKDLALTPEESVTFSKAIDTEMLANWPPADDEDPSLLKPPAGYHPTAQTLDLKSAKKDSKNNPPAKAEFSRGWSAALDAGGSGYSGGLYDILGVGPFIQMQFGYAFVPWEVGIRAEASIIRAGSPSAPKAATRGAGIYGLRTFTSWVIQPYVQITGYYGDVFQPGEPPIDYTSGFTLENTAGARWRFVHVPTVEVAVTLSASAAYSWMQPFAGSSGQGFSWRTALGVAFEWGSAKASSVQNQALQSAAPPAFF
ncbi:MAG: M48 family metallopeptidase, partial [Bdellovibrionota bacterium]